MCVKTDLKVYFISFPGAVHETARGRLEMILFNAVPSSTYPFKEVTGSTRFNYYNLLGCGLTDGRKHYKEADGGIRLTPIQTSMFLILVVLFA
jgi:hypothetical protein